MSDSFAGHPLTTFIAGLQHSQLPLEVAEVAALCILDTCAAMVCGAVSPVGRIGADYAASTWAPGAATLLANGASRTAAAAAFANAVAANGTDLDDVGRYTWGHPGAMVVPTALALAEEHGASGAQFLTAVVIGYEVAFRSARCLNYGAGGPPIDAAREYRACGAWGAAACAAVAAHISCCNPQQIVHALGIAEYHSPDAPMMRDLEHPAMVKHAHGIGALNGVLAAGLADRGFTGIRSRLYAPEYRDWTADAGRHYILPTGISWKEHSCCSYAHPTLDAVRRLRCQYGIDTARIQRVRVRAYSDAVRLGARVPDTSEEAQFSISWPVAVMLMDGEVHPRSMLPARLADAATRTLAERVELIDDPELTRRYLLSEAEQPGGEEAAVVEVVLDDGRILGPVHGSLVLFPVPRPGRDLVEAKFRWACAGLLPTRQIETVCQMSREFTRLQSVRELTEQLIARKSTTDGRVTETSL